MRSVFPSVSIEGDGANGRMSAQQLGVLRLYRVHNTPQRLLQRPSAPNAASMAILVQLSGEAHLEHVGHGCTLRAGQFTLLDETRPAEQEALVAHEQLIVRAPARLLGPPLPDRALAQVMTAESPSDKPLHDFVVHLWRSASALRSSQAAPVADSIAALVRLTTAVQAGRRDVATHVRVERAMRYILETIDDVELTPARVAAAQKISRRHLDELFRERGLTVASWLWEQRLLRAAELLGGRGAPSIKDVAYSVGFVSAAHFSRAFRRRFGVAPGAWQQRVPVE